MTDCLFIFVAIIQLSSCLIQRTAVLNAEQLKDNGEIYTVLKEEDYIGEFVRGQKIGSSISFTKLFNTNLNELKDFIIQENGYEKSL